MKHCIVCSIKTKQGRLDSMKSKIFRKLGDVANFIALMLVVQSANTACVWIFHEPFFPKEANKFKKVR